VKYEGDRAGSVQAAGNIAARLTFEQAAGIPIAATTALRGIREVGQARAGLRMLINGAAGGVGSYAVQIAAAFGAEVTGVCSTRYVELVRSLGATNAIDYTTDDFTVEPARYDVILDNGGNRPLAKLRRALAPTGILVLNGGGSPGHVFGPLGAIARAAVVNGFVRQRLLFLPTREDRTELAAITALVDDGKLISVPDRTYPLADTAEGLRHVESGHARGKVVVTWRAEASGETTSALRPELVGGVEIGRVSPDLGSLAVLDMEHLHGIVLERPALPLRPYRRQRDDVVVVADHVVQLDADRAARGLEGPAEPGHHVTDAGVVTAERAAARVMPADVAGKEAVLQHVEVATGERRVSLAH